MTLTFESLLRVLPFDDSTRMVVLARSEHGTIGCCEMTWEDAYPFVMNVFVLQTVRRCGVALALLREAERIAAEAGKEALSLYVREKNGAARGLYQKLGYATIMKQGADLHMVKRLRLEEPIVGVSYATDITPAVARAMPEVGGVF